MDPVTFDALFEATWRGLRAYLARASGDPALAEDLMQEAYLRVLEHPPRSTDPRAQRAYLYTTASRLLAAHWRRHRQPAWWRWWARSGEDDEPTPEPATGAPDPERVAMGREAVSRGWEGLSPRQRSLLWLAYVEGFDHVQLAAALGVRPASVKVLLHRARLRMAAALEPSDEETPR